jgi:hypothetical protein
MISARKVLLVGVGLAASALLWSGQASAQYYGREGYNDRGGRYDRGYERRDYGGRNDYGRQGNGRQDYVPRTSRNDPMAGMSMDERKNAIKNHREAQKKAIKRGYVIP